MKIPSSNGMCWYEELDKECVKCKWIENEDVNQCVSIVLHSLVDCHFFLLHNFSRTFKKVKQKQQQRKQKTPSQISVIIICEHDFAIFFCFR